MNKTESAVLVDGVSKSFAKGDATVHALRGASMSVGAGEFVAVMGPSGSGKSTLLGLIAGLDVCDSGSIRVCGNDIHTMSDSEVTLFRRRNIGMVYQNFNLLGDLTIEENVGAPLMLDGVRGEELALRVESALKQVDLLERRGHLPGAVSGGEMQRAAIARALVVEPAVLLADEPTGSLDSSTGERILLDMRRAVDELGRTVVMVTHHQLAAAYADRTLSLLDGKFEER